jgi:hypothetical protein
MILGAWRRSWLAYSFDRYGGRFWRRFVRLGDSLPLSGFGTVEKTIEHGRMFFCLYRWGGRMWFQAGGRTWCLDSGDLRLAYRLLPGGRGSEFTVTENHRISFRCSYAHRWERLFTRGAAGEDNVDCEGRHFLAHVAGHSLPLADSDAWHDVKALHDGQAGHDGQQERQAILAHLQRLADLVKQGDRQRPDATLEGPADLFYSWIDDSYRPSSVTFQQAFAPQEREQLRKFTDVLQFASWEIEEADADPQAPPLWARVVQDAEQTLRDLPVSLPPRH